jgi:hypothetical protein
MTSSEGSFQMAARQKLCAYATGARHLFFP